MDDASDGIHRQAQLGQLCSEDEGLWRVGFHKTNNKPKKIDRLFHFVISTPPPELQNGCFYG
jgi:hypothetical protein